MIIKSPGTEALAYMCPACGNYYFESAVCSYSNFGAVCFSDGSYIGGYKPCWLTKCPRCKQYIAKRHLFKLPKPVMLREMLRTGKGYSLSNTGEQYGYFDHLYSEEKGVELWEDVIKQGLYFPVLVREWEKRECDQLMYISLWRSYNHDEKREKGAAYTEVCKKLIELLHGKNDEEKILLAELYRNIGEFEESQKYLDGVNNTERYRDVINCIRNQNEKKNTKTVRVEKERRKW